ncbi:MULTISPECIES: hypothetical protein [Streptomyces]|uniref:hypothetical protein n=1 Tax=Streptomyces TaxID=1883 RepID=UPI0022489776|nr:hypothetical protein [Streptomyces sp. JHD 1]MCX2968139.1 hypothetical protein [Streptomyces sp. JHD 1]
MRVRTALVPAALVVGAALGGAHPATAAVAPPQSPHGHQGQHGHQSQHGHNHSHHSHHNHYAPVVVVSTGEVDDPMEDVLEHTLNFGDGYTWD